MLKFGSPEMLGMCFKEAEAKDQLKNFLVNDLGEEFHQSPNPKPLHLLPAAEALGDLWSTSCQTTTGMALCVTALEL